MAMHTSSPVRCGVRCLEGYGSPRLQSTPIRGSQKRRTPLKDPSSRGSPVSTPLRTPRLSWSREQSSLQKWKKSLRDMELSDSAKTLKNIQIFKNSQEVIRNQAKQIKDLTSQAIILRKEAKCQEVKQEQLHLGIQTLEQEKTQILVRVVQEKERNQERVKMVEIMEERMKEMERQKKHMHGWEQEQQQSKRMIELKNKVAELIEDNLSLMHTIDGLSTQRLTSGQCITPISKKTPLRKAVALRNMSLSESLLNEVNYSFEMINESCEVSFGVMAMEEDAPISLEEEMQALRNHNKPLLLIIISRIVRMLRLIKPGKRQGT